MRRCWDSRSPGAIKGREPGVCGRQVLRDARSRGCEMMVSRREGGERGREKQAEAEMGHSSCGWPLGIFKGCL